MLSVASAGRTFTLFFIGYVDNSDAVIGRHRLVFTSTKHIRAFKIRTAEFKEAQKQSKKISVQTRPKYTQKYSQDMEL